MISRPCLRFASALLLLASVSLTGCGGGGSSPGGTVTPPPNPTLSISQTSIPEGVTGRSYSTTLTATGGVGALTWSAESMPPGLTLSANGTISGTPTASGHFAIDVRVKDSDSPPQTFGRSFELRVFDLLTLQASPSVTVTRSVPYDYTFLAQPNAGKAPYKFKIEGTVPGMMLKNSDWTAVLQGTPTTAGTYPLRITVEDSLIPSQSAVVDVPVVVDTKFALLPPPSDFGVVGRPYSSGIPVANGTPPITWEIDTSRLPRGLSLDTGTGIVSGTALEPWAGYSPVVIRDSSVPPAVLNTVKYLNIYDVLRVENATLEDARYNEYHSQSLRAIGGAVKLNSRLLSGTLPPGLQIQSNGIFGIPTAQGTYNFGVELQDSATPPQVWRQLYSLTVLPRPVFVGTESLPNAGLGSPYAAQLFGRSGTPPYRWSVDAGLPPGLSVTATGKIAGTPQTAGVFRPRFTVTDSASPAQSHTAALAIRVESHPLRRNDTIATATPADNMALLSSLSVSPYADPVYTPNPDTDYYRLVADAGAIVKLHVRAHGNLDSVLEVLDASGVLYKTCIDPGDDTPPTDLIAKDTTPQAYDDTCMNDDIQLGEDISSRLEFKVPGTPGTQTTFYAHVLDFRGDARPDMHYEISSEGLVPRLYLYSNLGGAVTGKNYTGQIMVGGGTGTPTLNVHSGTLPPGLTMTAGGQVTGVPTTVGTYQFEIQASDSANPPQTTTIGSSIQVVAPFKIITESIPSAVTGDPYSVTFASEGGRAHRTWVIYGSVPRGLLINNGTATISGVPEQTGTFDFSVSVWDGLSSTSRQYSLAVSAGPLSVATSTVSDAYVGWDYITELKAKGGTPSSSTPRFQWAAIAGSLPPGMELRSDGALTGRPTTAGTYSFTVQVTDAATPAQVATGVVTMTVRPSP